MLLEDASTIEVTVMTEVIVNRAIGRCEFLKRGRTSEPCHGLFSSPEGLMRILGPIVEPSARLMTSLIADLAISGRIRWKPIGHDGIGGDRALHGFLSKSKGSLTIPCLGGEGFGHFAFVIHSPLEIVGFAIDPDENLIEIPAPG